MMRRLVVLPIVLLAALPGAARAAFPAPVQLAAGGVLGATAAVDAGGNGVVIVTGGDGGPRLFERSGPVAPWGADVRLPGRELGGAKGPVVAAAGAGAAVVAWRNDTPRRYRSIVAMVRDPGGAWSVPATVSDDDANGVRHPAAAIDARGDAVLAYNSNTRTSHLSMMGAVTVALRVPGSGFGQGVTVEEVPKASAPAVAIGPDGRGLVAWVRNRQIWAVDVDVVAGSVGKVKALTPKGRWGLVHVAAGPGATATVVARGASGVDSGTALYAVRRPADGSFAGRRFQVLQRFTRKSQTFVQEVAVAADEDGRTTIAWAPESFGRASGFTAGIRFAVAGEGATAFSRARDLIAQDTPLDCTNVSVAATAGRAAVAWVCSNRKTYTFQTALINNYNITGPTTFATGAGVPPSYYARPSILAGLDATGTTTLVLTRPDPLEPRTSATERVLTTTGR